MKLKRSFLAISAFLISLSFSTYALPGISIDAGLNYSDMDIKGFKSQLESKISELEITDHSKIWSPRVGVGLKLKVFPTLSIRTGAALSMKGVKIKHALKSDVDNSQLSSDYISSSFLDVLNQANANYSFDVSYRFLYLEVPVMAQVKLPVPILSPAFFGGVNMGFLLNEKMPSQLDYLSDLDKVELSGIIGFSVKAPLVNLPLPIIPELHIVCTHQSSLKASIEDANSSVTTIGLELQLL